MGIGIVVYVGKDEGISPEKYVMMLMSVVDREREIYTPYGMSFFHDRTQRR